MASHKIGEASTSNHHHMIQYGVLDHGINSPSSTLINQGSAFDFGGLEEAIVLQGMKIRDDHHESKASLFTTGKPAATLEMFPSWPMRFHHPLRGGSKSGGESTDSESAMNTISISSKTEAQFEPESESQSAMSSKKAFSSDYHQNHNQAFDNNKQNDASRCQTQNQNQNQPPAAKFSHQEKRKGVASSSSEKQLDAKTLRRLAQNREAARKSRLRKKAYVQQLESSRLKLSQLEQELHRARSQGILMGCGESGSTSGNINPGGGGAVFDMEYGRWLEEDHRQTAELRRSLEAAIPDGELRAVVDTYLSHYDEIFQLKGVAVKSDVFHLINGMWATPAERCFLWIAGFKPSDLIMMVIQQLEPLAEQQVMGMYALRQSSQEAEQALSQGLDQLQQSLVDTIAGGLVIDGVQQMLLAMGKLSNLEGFIRQADNLRQQTLHQLCRLLTVRQAARCFLVIGEYYARLRALSSLWASRPRESLINVNDENSCQAATNMPIVQSSQHHFSSF